MYRQSDNILLDGTWEFRLDPDNSGESGQWYSLGTSFEERITVPGSWNAQGYGEETDKLKHGYAGKAWYKKKVFIKRNLIYPVIWLDIGGAHRYCRIWVNGTYAGEHLAYTSPFRFNITSLVELDGENEITLQIDSRQRKEIDRLKGTFDVIDFMELEWGGIYRSVNLEFTTGVWIQDLYVSTDLDESKVALELDIMNSGTIADIQLACFVRKNEFVLTNTSKIKLKSGKNIVFVNVGIETPILWSPENPELYDVNIKLLYRESILDDIKQRFGFRKLEITENEFYLNKKPYFIRGYGDDCIYPLDLCPAPDKAYFIEFIKLVKAFGFNAVRHHSHFPYPEYFEAADEVGLLIQPELPICCIDELKNLNKSARELFIREWAELVRLNRNHPCIMAYSQGNELYDGFYFERELYDIAKRLDPERLVIGSDGTVGITGVTRYDLDRETLDYIVALLCQQYIFPYGENRDILKEELYRKPIIVHEMGNYCSLGNIQDIDKFTGAVKPYWLNNLKKLIDEKEMERGTYEKLLNNSFKLQWICHKTNMEAARLCSSIKGYHFWTIVDYYGTTQGLLNMFLDQKGISPEELRKVNDRTVILWDSSIRCFEAGTTLPMELVLSRYDDVPVTEEIIIVEVMYGDKMLSQTKEIGLKLSGYGVIALGKIEIRVPEIDFPRKMSIKVTLEGSRVSNSWDIWVFPRKTDIFDMNYGICAGTGLEYLVQERMNFSASISQDTRLFITDRLDESVLSFLDGGGKVLLIPERGTLEEMMDRNTFKLAWWKSEDMSFHCANNLKVSSMVESHPLLGDFPQDGYADLQFYYMIQMIEGIKVEKWPSEINPLIYDLTAQLDKICYVFEAGVGEGRLVVCTLDLAEDRCRDHVEIRYLFSRLINYLTNCGPYTGKKLNIQSMKKMIKAFLKK